MWLPVGELFKGVNIGVEEKVQRPLMVVSTKVVAVKNKKKGMTAFNSYMTHRSISF